MNTVIIDYDSGNLHSAEKAFQRMAADAGAGKVVVTSRPDRIAAANRLVLPGVGAFADCMRGLRQREGLFEAMTTAALVRRVPFLGICVGMQLLASTGWEFGRYSGLDWIPGDVVKIRPDESALKIPHMGWNELVFNKQHPVFDGIGAGAHAYFVHSYHFQPSNPSRRIAHTHHGEEITAAIELENLVGFQFHPEKSQATGLRLIRNFLTWNP